MQIHEEHIRKAFAAYTDVQFWFRTSILEINNTTTEMIKFK